MADGNANVKPRAGDSATGEVNTLDVFEKAMHEV
jgi:hypothetical protein